LPGERRVGPHLPVGSGLLRVAERAAEIGATAVQIFTDNPTSWRRREVLPPEVPVFRERLAQLDIGPLAIHAAYLVNLAGPDDIFFGKSIEVMRHEFAWAPAYGARFVNVHAGSHRGSGLKAGVGRLADGLARASSEAPAGRDAPLPVVENSSGGGDSIGVTIEELAAIAEAAARRGLARLGFCLDTAHLWGAGYDISTAEGMERVLGRFDRLIGLDRLAMIHLNDTHLGLGSRHDRHAHLGEGQIGPAAMAHLLRHDSLAGVAFYLETPHMEQGYDAVNMARVHDLVAGRPGRNRPAPREQGASGARPAALAVASGTARGQRAERSHGVPAHGRHDRAVAPVVVAARLHHPLVRASA
jgi:deoxyribonuclease-4